MSQRSMFLFKAVLGIMIATLTITPCLLPQSVQAQSVGEMDGFWRRATMVDVWLKGGGGLMTIPDYVSDARSSFPYIKRPYSKEYPHADTMILVRILGGWRPDSLGKGEAAAYSNIEEADVVTYDGSKLTSNKTKFIDRVRPFVDAGYEDLVIVLDNIPWSLSGPHASLGNYGNRGHAQHPGHMYWVGRMVSQWLVEEFGPVANKFTFRYGTETEAGVRYTGTAWNYFQEYDNVCRGLRYNLPDALLGPGNFYKLIDAEQTAKLKDFLGYIQNNGSPGVSVDYVAASRYLRVTGTGVGSSASAAVNETMNYFDSLNVLYGSTVLKYAGWHIDEFGFVSGSEPGAFGGALLFNLICGHLQRGIDEMQHWKPYDQIGANYLWTSEGSIYTIFDHLRGGLAYVRSITPLLNSAEGMSMVIKKGQYTYVILSAVNTSRSTQPNQNFNYSFPVSESAFTDPSEVKIEYLSLDRTALPHDIARNDLAAAGLLVAPYSGEPNRVANVQTMGGTAGRNYVIQNFSKYSQAYIDAMTLKNYSGSLTQSGSEFRLAVQNMRTPSIMVFRMKSEITPPASPTALSASAVSSSRINLTWNDNSNNETGFLIQRRIGTGTWSNLATVGANVTSYANTGLTAGTLYGYRVRAENTAGNSVFTPEASATTPVNTYTVTYNANGATSGTAPANQTKTHDVALTLQTNSGNLARTGYTFAGWNTAANGSGTSYAAGGSYTANAAATMYARWTPSAGALPAPWSSQDIGTVGAAGNASASSGIFTIRGSGADIWGTADAFRYVYQQTSGDVTITARLAGMQNTHAWAKAGVMIRETLNANSKHAMTVVTPANGVSFQRRISTGGTSSHTTISGLTAPYWVRIVRSGNNFSAFRSPNGTSWTQIGSTISIPMSSTVYVGLPVTSHANGTLCEATIDNVTIQTATPVNTYTVTYNANGATSGTAPANQTKTHDVALTLQANSGNLARTGYTFAGWNTAANGSGTSYAVGASYTANAAVTLYARWTGGTSTYTFNPGQDAYLQSGTRFNDTYLKVEAGKRVAYIKFNVNTGGKSITGATLKLQCSGDSGNGTIRVYKGSHNNWTETTLSDSNKPAQGAQLASKASSYSIGTVYEWNVGSGVSADGEVTFILTMDSGGNDAWFSSKEGSYKPELVVVSGTTPVNTYTVTYNANGATSGTAPANQTKTHDVALTLQTNSGNLARTGYTFAGWDTAANGSGTSYAAGASYTANAAVTLYARWTGGTSPLIVYQVFQGHDGHPDPDDNAASLAGYFAIKRNIERNAGRVEYCGMVYGDTIQPRKNAMNGGSSGGLSGDNTAKANYQFYKQYTVPAHQSVGNSVFYDVTPQVAHFNATSLNQMTTAGQELAKKIKTAIDASSPTTLYRVVYSAGGGQNSAAEAIKYLQNTGNTEAKIRAHFAIVQHSRWNWDNASEATARTITANYTIFIADQNAYTGVGKIPLAVSASRTSATFADAWAVAVGSKAPSPSIAYFQKKDDASDAGSHHCASRPESMDAFWSTRNNLFSNRFPYAYYNKAQMEEDMVN